MASKPCIQKKKSLWDGSVVTWCGKRGRWPDHAETWLNYTWFTRGDTCRHCVAAHDAAAGR